MEEKSFFEKVYELVRQIPEGRVTTYGAIARFLGAGQSARVVGWAMNNAHGKVPSIPAHRVVNAVGLLTGKHHFQGIRAMQECLENEGIKVVNNQIIDFENRFWDPSKELLDQ